MIKKNPSYRITVYNQTETIIVEYPLTCKFNSQRGTFSQSNKCTIDIYNLSETTRARIFKDALTLDQANWKYIKLEAGWNGQLSQIFMGRILQAYSSKSGGQVDIITHIECQPFDIFSSQSSYTFAAGTTYKDAYKTMAADLGNVEIGNIGNLEGTFKTQTTFEGNTLECLNRLTGGNTFVDNGVLNTIMGNEVIDVPVPLVTDSNGLLATPVRRDASLTIKMLFEPTLIVGQLLEVKSVIQPQYNGQYKVLGFTHDCMISPTQAGQRITTVDLWIAPLLTNTDINITNEGVTNSYNKVKGEQVTNVVGAPPNWIKPVNGSIRSSYGYRIHPIYKTRKFHDGIDFGAPLNAPVKACASGTVSYAGWNGGYGKYISISHSNGYMSFYGHLNSIGVKQGQKVSQGQEIGKVGSTGNSTGAHLHLGAKLNGKSIDPKRCLKN